jgi:hypothetical protein
LTGDGHYRPDRPLCRLDLDWMQTQKDVLFFIADLANARHADIIDTGDNFNTPRVPDEVKSLYLEFVARVNGMVHTIPANHTLPYHQMKNINESSIGVLASIAKLHTPNLVVHMCDEANEDGRFEHSVYLTDDVLLCHTLTFPSEDEIPFYGKATSAQHLMMKYRKAKWILLGDNHHHFLVKDRFIFPPDKSNNYAVDDKICYVINPGTPIVQVADMLDYEPGVYYIDTKTEEIEWIPVPYDRSMVTNDHITEQHERDERIAAFMEAIPKDGKVSLSFEDNFARAVESSKLDQNALNFIEEIQNGSD